MERIGRYLAFAAMVALGLYGVAQWSGAGDGEAHAQSGAASARTDPSAEEPVAGHDDGSVGIMAEPEDSDDWSDEAESG